MRKITWLGVIFAVLFVLSLFLPQYPDVARAAPVIELLHADGAGIKNKWDYVTKDNLASNDGDTSYAQSIKKKTYMYATVADSAVNSGSISSVTVKGYFKTGEAGQTITVGMYDGANLIQGTATDPGQTSYGLVTYSNSTNPSGGAWTWTNINSLEITAKADKKAAAMGDWRCTEFWIEVNYELATISITVTDENPTGITFGDADPGSTNNPDQTAAGFSETKGSVTVSVDTGTNVDVDLKISGTDFDDPDWLISHAKYSTTYTGTKTAMSTSPTKFAGPLSAGESQKLWHWLDVPSGITAGDYSSTFTYQALEYTGG